MRVGTVVATAVAVSTGFGTAAAQQPRPEYRIEAEVADGRVRAEMEVRVPGSLSSAWGGVEIDTARAAGAPFEIGGILREPDAGPGGAEGTRARVRWTVAVDSSDLAQLGYFLFPSDAPGTRWYPEATGAGGERAAFADYDVRLRWPAGTEVLTTGAGDPERRDDGGFQARFRARHVEGFTLVVAPGHERVALERGDVRVDVVAPPDLVETFTTVGERALEAAAFYRDLYGFFPTGRLGIVPGPEGFAGGWPLPNLFMIHRGRLDAEFLRFVTAHELGHYYWGHYVLSASPDRLDWVMLANGIWADQLYLASHHGRPLEAQWRATGEGDWMMDAIRAALAGREQTLGLDRAAAADLEYDYNTLVRHGKGATGLYLLARLAGRERFVEVQRGILRDFRYRPLPLDTLANRLEASGVEEAGTFLRAWMRGDASIGYRVESNDSVGDGRQRIVIRRIGTVPYPVTLEAVGADGRRTRLAWDPAARRDTVWVEAVPPVTVRQDPEGAVPTWNSDHPEIQRLYVLALAETGWTRPFLELAESYLRRVPDPEVREAVERVRGE